MSRQNTSRSIVQLRNVIEEFMQIEPDFPASYAAVFLFVAQFEKAHGEGPIQRDIGDALGLGKSTVSRIVMALADLRRGNRAVEKKARARPSLGLLEREDDPENLRITRIRLSAKGRRFLARLSSLIEPGVA